MSDDITSLAIEYHKIYGNIPSNFGIILKNLMNDKTRPMLKRMIRDYELGLKPDQETT